MIWNEDHILGLISDTLEHQSSVFAAEQAVRSIDCLTENVIRDRIMESFAAAGMHAVQEERYPAARCIQQRNYSDRCDLALLPNGAPVEGAIPVESSAPTTTNPSRADPR